MGFSCTRSSATIGKGQSICGCRWPGSLGRTRKSNKDIEAFCIRWLNANPYLTLTTALCPVTANHSRATLRTSWELAPTRFPCGTLRRSAPSATSFAKRHLATRSGSQTLRGDR
eukprot:1289790-Prymnesium_polylepis.2